MNPWLTIWTCILVGGIGVFAVLTVVVAIGGFADIRAMLRDLDEQHREEK
jgi:hypothetical protein